MNLKEQLQIILITYNRCAYLERTLKQVLAVNSPVRDFPILVLDNNSTDGTQALVQRLQQNHTSLSYHKNSYNLGLGGNIARALEIGSREYLWVLCDDDLFDFGNWPEVEKFLNAGERCVCVSRYALPEEHKNDPAYQLLQMSFVPATIFHKSLFNDTVMFNVTGNIYTLFPHLCPLVAYLSHGGRIAVVEHAVVSRKETASAADCSYWRGADPGNVYPRLYSMQWIAGYSEILSALKNKKLKAHCLNVATHFSKIAPNLLKAVGRLLRKAYQNPLYWVHVYDFGVQLNLWQKIVFWLCRIRAWLQYGLLYVYHTPEGTFVKFLNRWPVAVRSKVK